MTDLLLRFSHNIVEHLGLKLYQNKPTRVIAELVSNAWDADATRVAVNLSMEQANRWVAVHDNGHGMSRVDLARSYLIIGKDRRSRSDERSKRGRYLMGRKGIGKLAPFGIARAIDVVTSGEPDAGGPPEVHWLRFQLSALLGKGDAEFEYRPEILADRARIDAIPAEKDPTGQVKVWKGTLGAQGTGTLVIMTDMSLSRAIPTSTLMSSLGERFTVTVGRDFTVAVNGAVAAAGDILPECEFRIPTDGNVVEIVGGREVRAWVGFVKNASWPQDAAGVGVYSHGKIAQDRPFTFGVKGREIFTRYMFGVVEADWLDDMPEDLISTDRTSINWDAPQTQDLHKWGQGKVREWIGAFEKWRGEEEEVRNREMVQAAVRAGDAPRVTPPEEDEIVRLVSAITPSFGKDLDSKKRLIRAVSDAWVQKPMRRLIRDLWSSIGADDGMPPERFTELVERLSSHAVPESLNLAVVFAQRAFALTRLHDYVLHGTETHLQRLIERFPWIVEPDLAVLTANQTLRTAVMKAEQLGHIPTGRRVAVAGVPETNKPDFVFLSSPEERQIVIVELKNPQEDLTIDNRRQLEDYMGWLEAHYPKSQQKAFLIGRRPDGLQIVHKDMIAVPWTEVLQRSRARNLELLAAMLLGTSGASPSDARIADAIELGGPEAKALLERLAAEHDELRALMEEFRVVGSGTPAIAEKPA